MTGDEFYDDEVTSGVQDMRYDVLAAADWKRDQLKNSFSCATCGSPDPAIIKGSVCSDCQCMLIRHIPGCPGKSGGEHVLKGVA